MSRPTALGEGETGHGGAAREGGAEDHLRLLQTQGVGARVRGGLLEEGQPVGQGEATRRDAVK